MLVTVLVLVGGAVFITRELSTKEPRKEEPWLFRLNLEDIEHISVTHRDARMDYVYSGDQWVMKDGADTPVFTEKWAGTTLLLSGPRSSRTLADRIDDLAKYGLDSPQTKVKIIDRSGSPLEFHLGDATPDDKTWYARLAGSSRLFTVASEYGEVISKLATEPPYPPTPTPESPEGLETTESVATGDLDLTVP